MVATNKLSIYLMKESISSPSEIIKDIETAATVPVDDIGTFYYWPSFKKPPQWVSGFFGNALGETANIFGSVVKAVLLVTVNVTPTDTDPPIQRVFAITFGVGRFAIEADACEDQFGLRTVLNTVEPDRLRAIQAKNIASIPRNISEQLSKEGGTASFGIDPEQCLVANIVGVSHDSNFGKLISGRDSLSVSVRKTISDIKEFLVLCYQRFCSDEYKDQFDWVDQIAEVKSPGIRAELEGQLLSNLRNNDFTKTWMAVPTIIQWAEVSGFKYSMRGDLHDDIDIQEFLGELREDKRSNLTVGFLKSKPVLCMRADAEQVYEKWPAYACLYCEVLLDGRVYLLSDKKWYEINYDYAARINEEYEKFRAQGTSVKLPAMQRQTQQDGERLRLEKENVYNERVCRDNGEFQCLDCKTIQYGTAHSKVEPCDIYSREGKFIHVKKYGASSVLSHLFSQGLVSAELFLSDIQFRERLNEKLSNEFKVANIAEHPAAGSYEVVYAITSSKTEALELPFFSKVTLLHAKRRLTLYGFKVSLAKIDEAIDGSP